MAELWTPGGWEKSTGGRLDGPLQPWSAAGEVFIDSRSVPDGGVFVPLKGERTDGHLYIAEVLTAGCRAVMVGQGFHSQVPLWKKSFPRAGFLLVRDTFEALGDLAAWHVGRLPLLTKIGITGSNGKTTTKEMTAAVVRTLGETFYTEGNLNSEIGLPLMCLRLRPDHRFAVLEMGINHRGEMAHLARIFRPSVCVVTNVGTAHIGMIGSQDQIALEKKEIFSYAGRNGHAVIPGEDPYSEVLGRDFPGMVHRFSLTQGVEILENLGPAGVRFAWKGLEINLPLAGLHNVRNALAALTVGEILGADARAMKPALESVKPLFGRGEWLAGPVTILQDCYNANYDSMVSLLDMAQSLSWQGRKFLVLGSMKELGAETERFHGLLGERVSGLAADGVFFFGREAKAARDAYARSGGKPEAFWSEDFDELRAAVLASVRSGDLVVLKGSRGTALERLTESLRAAFPG